MKKIIVILFSLLLVAGCANRNSYSSLSDGKDVIFSGPKVSYAKEDLYKSLKVSSADAIVNDILKNIALKYVDDMSEIEKEADDVIAEYTEMGYEAYIIAYYGTIDAFRDYYVSNLLLNELAKEYVSEKYDELIAEDKPVKMQIASFNTVEEAEKCIEDYNNGSTFDMAALNNNSNESPQSSIYTDDDSSLVYEVKEYLNSNDALGLSPVIIYATTTTDDEGNDVEDATYYVLNVESRDPEEFKDDYISTAAASASSDSVKEYFLNKHQIKFYDQDLYDLVTAQYEGLK
ncbi:MAG: membrane lipoprotein lipid attachment site-containing protein [Erysipelotrichaceae bacterium]|nr:membrane lipoprotein lipid attachment site-containing protein [Erysipelotrichaceae bacterium]